MKIYLIGMPGSGKTTVGKLLAKEFNLPFYDIDALIEKDALMFIDDLIEKYGVKKFRELETEILEKLNITEGIISTGGGIVENRKNKESMDGVIIYLDVSNDVLEKRLKNDYPRPLLKETTIEDLYNKRFLMYQHFATYNVSNNNDLDKTILSIKEVLGK